MIPNFGSYNLKSAFVKSVNDLVELATEECFMTLSDIRFLINGLGDSSCSHISRESNIAVYTLAKFALLYKKNVFDWKTFLVVL